MSAASVRQERPSLLLAFDGRRTALFEYTYCISYTFLLVKLFYQDTCTYVYRS